MLFQSLGAAIIWESSFESTEEIPMIRFGQPEISQQSIGSGNTLEFEGLLSYEQIQIPISTTSSRLFVSYDIYGENIVNSDFAFTQFFDTPSVRTLSIHGGLNNFQVFQPFGVGGSLLPFEDERVYHIDHIVDFDLSSWVVLIDDVIEFSAPINATEVQSIRFSMSPWTGAANADSPETIILMDNLVISTAPIPEPRTLGSLVLVVMAVCCRRYRSAKF